MDNDTPTISHVTMMRIPKMSKPLLSGDAITVVTSCNENIKQVYHYKTNIKVELYEKNIKLFVLRIKSLSLSDVDVRPSKGLLMI